MVLTKAPLDTQPHPLPRDGGVHSTQQAARPKTSPFALLRYHLLSHLSREIRREIKLAVNICQGDSPPNNLSPPTPTQVRKLRGLLHLARDVLDLTVSQLAAELAFPFALLALYGTLDRPPRPRTTALDKTTPHRACSIVAASSSLKLPRPRAVPCTT
jgi:hypothetical protein